MATFNKNKLTLNSQSIAGMKVWGYTDTGLLIADVNEIAGFFTTGYECGMRHGDRVEITEGDTGTWDTTGRQTGGRRQYVATVLAAGDTGAPQIPPRTSVLVRDTP